jgi:hypothetical protein
MAAFNASAVYASPRDGIRVAEAPREQSKRRLTTGDAGLDSGIKKTATSAARVAVGVGRSSPVGIFFGTLFSSTTVGNGELPANFNPATSGALPPTPSRKPSNP